MFKNAPASSALRRWSCAAPAPRRSTRGRRPPIARRAAPVGQDLDFANITLPSAGANHHRHEAGFVLVIASSSNRQFHRLHVIRIQEIRAEQKQIQLRLLKLASDFVVPFLSGLDLQVAPDFH